MRPQRQGGAARDRRIARDITVSQWMSEMRSFYILDRLHP
jgi:hypothetical protein